MLDSLTFSLGEKNLKYFPEEKELINKLSFALERRLELSIWLEESTFLLTISFEFSSIEIERFPFNLISEFLLFSSLFHSAFLFNDQFSYFLRFYISYKKLSFIFSLLQFLFEVSNVRWDPLNEVIMRPLPCQLSVDCLTLSLLWILFHTFLIHLKSFIKVSICGLKLSFKVFTELDSFVIIYFLFQEVNKVKKILLSSNEKAYFNKLIVLDCLVALKIGVHSTFTKIYIKI